MTRWLGVGLVAALVAACASPTVTPSPAAAPAATWDPRRDQIDQAQAVWTAEQPDTYAYTSTRWSSDSSDGRSFRVTGMDGRVVVQALGADGAAKGDDGRSMTIEALFETAREALDGDGTLTFEVEHAYGYPASTQYEASTAGGSWRHAITEFTTAATRTSAAQARQALDLVRQRWDALNAPAWEYTWSRFGAGDTDSTAATWRVRHDAGKTTVSTENGSGGTTPPDAVTVEGTIAALSGVLAAGGWVDVSVAATDGLDLLAAVDPSPSAKGDAYWIRIAYNNLAAEKAAEALAGAQKRWASGTPKRYAYTWRYEGPDASWRYRVTVNGDRATIKPGKGAPPPEGSFAAPRIPEMFALIERAVAAGGSTSVTYDKKLGYPTRIALAAATEATPGGVITITDFKTR